jgi:hypothetical protein
MPLSYSFERNWDGVDSKIPGKPKNHDSKMNQDEVKRLVQEGIELILIPKFKTLPKKHERSGLAKVGKKVVAGTKAVGSMPIRIMKGIHQFTMYDGAGALLPHITVMACIDEPHNGPALHIWLSQKPTAGTDGKVSYQAVAVSEDEKGPYLPDITVVNAPAPRTRSASIGAAELKILMSEKEGA